MFVALDIQHAMRLRCIILSSVACPALLYFATLSHKQQDIWKNTKVTECKLCFGFLYNFCPKHSHYKKN